MRVFKTIKQTVIAVLLASIGGMAHAGLILEQTRAPVTVPAAAQPGSADAPVAAGEAGKAFPHRHRIDLDAYMTENITQSGTPPTELPAIKGGSRNTPMMTVLRQLVPLGWKVYSDVNLDPDVRINWNGKRNWVLILNDILPDAHLKAHIDWSEREITLSPAPVRAVKAGRAGVTLPRGAIPLADSLADGEVVLQMPPEKGAPPVVIRAPVPPPAVWRMVKERSVRENLDAWAKQIGWRLVWSARKGDKVYDYPSDPFANNDFTGELVGTTGVIARVIAAFVDSDPPLAVEFFRANKTIEVTLYKPSSIQGVSQGLRDATQRQATQSDNSHVDAKKQ